MAIFGDKRKVMFVKKMSGIYNSVGKSVLVKPDQNRVRMRIAKRKFRSFILDTGKPFLRSGNVWIYLVDVEAGQLTFNPQLPLAVSGEFIDAHTARSTIEKIVTQAEKPQLMSFLLYIIMGVLCGTPFGYILGNFWPIP